MEILFRGKGIENGKWFYGYLYDGFTGFASVFYITENQNGLRKVDPKTIGQYVGITDIDGKRIFTNDTIDIFFDSCVGRFKVEYGENTLTCVARNINCTQDKYTIAELKEMGETIRLVDETETEREVE